MRFLTREFAGWALMLLGLILFTRSYKLLTLAESRLIEGVAVALMGIVIFRGGIHLLKIALAARICLEARQSLSADRRPAISRLAAPKAKIGARASLANSARHAPGLTAPME